MSFDRRHKRSRQDWPSARLMDLVFRLSPTPAAFADIFADIPTEDSRSGVSGHHFSVKQLNKSADRYVVTRSLRI